MISKTIFLCEEVTEQVDLNNLFFGFGYVSITVLEILAHEARDE